MSARIPENSRLEIKFVADEYRLDQLTTWLTLHAARFRASFPPREINSVYFDTYDFSAYRQNLTGYSSRTKVRYRWYGQSRHPGAGALEFKSKRNQFGWKTVHAIEEMPLAPDERWSDFLRNICRRVPPKARLVLSANPQPVVLIRYTRAYYASSDKLIRATVDWNQRAYDQRYKPFPNVTRPANSPARMVLEFKFARAHRERAVDIIRTLPARMSRHSKYAISVKSVQGF